MSNLPAQLTPFIGRVEEISEIQQLLALPECRLLTLVGVGGIGKTRLALQVAGQKRDAFEDGVYFVALQPITSLRFLISSISDALGFTARGADDAQSQLFNYLRQKELLLLIDNFEQMLNEVNFLVALLEAAPSVKLLVTSREMLRLREEWVYQIHGLAYPKVAAPLPEGREELAGYSALQLFIERARRVRRGPSLAAEVADIVSICQMVEGMPLALELAAAWTQSLSCRAIADEIRQNLDFLATDWRNVPDRQRSMRVVFDYSRNLLTPEEQVVFARLSVFRGGFHRKASEEIAGASLATLGSLVSCCLVRWDPQGRYQLHELLRQYAEEQLRESPSAKAAIDERHCIYYAEFLHQRLPDLMGKGQLEAIHAIEDELENIRAAWQYAVETENQEAIGKAVQALALFYGGRSRELEAVKLFEEATDKWSIFESTDPDVMLLAIRFQELAWFYIRLGRFDDAQRVQERVQFCYEQLGISPIYGAATDPLLIAGMLAIIRGEYEAALSYADEALQKTTINPHLKNRQYTLYLLSSATLAQGDFHAAREYAEAAVAVAHETGDRWATAHCLIELGNVACALDDYEAAYSYFMESYVLRKEFDDPEGMAIALVYLGEIALRREGHDEAKRCYERSFALYRGINDLGGLARSLEGLGNALYAAGDYEGAREHLRNALEIANEIKFVALICQILAGIGDLFVQTGNHASGLALMVQISRHPSSTTTCKARARQLLLHYQSMVDSDLFEMIMAQDQIETVNTLVEKTQIELATIEFTIHPRQFSPPTPTPLSVQTTPQPLVEPLTVREMEILELVAKGLTNQQIAATLYITRGTVKWYTSQIYSKLGIESRTQAIGRARALNLIS